MSFFKSLIANLNPKKLAPAKAAETAQSQLPSDWEEKLQNCDFQLARSELQDFFAIVNRQAAVQGQEALFKESLVRAWKRFSEEPCFETAKAFITDSLENGAILWPYFRESCPGGQFALYKSMLKKR